MLSNGAVHGPETTLSNGAVYGPDLTLSLVGSLCVRASREGSSPSHLNREKIEDVPSAPPTRLVN